MSTPLWFKNYPAGVPRSIDNHGISSIGEVFTNCSKKFSRNGAFTCMGRTISYSDLDKRSADFGAWLTQKAGLVPGDRVAIMMPNLLQYPIALFGILRSGLVVVNVNPLYTPRELEHQIKDSGAKALILIENFATTFQSIAGSFPDLQVITTEVGDLLPPHKRLLVNFVVKHVKKMVPEFSIHGAVGFRQVLREGSRLRFAPHKSQLTDLAFLQYTGGTTGVAKGAMLTHGNIVSNLSQISAWVSTDFVSGKEVAISPLPLYHIFCLSSMLAFMSWGARNVLVTNPRELPELVELLSSEKWTILTAVNTLFNGLLNTKGFDQIDFSKAKLCLGGGAAVQRPIAEAWKLATGIYITEAYGLTETSPGATVNPIGAPFRGSIGLPLPSTSVTIRSDNFKSLAPWDRVGPIEDCTGEICIKGPQVMRGYWQRPEETQEAIRDGWLLTGDIGHMDKDGFFYITDRKKDMILVSGFNVYPTEIEEVLACCPGILEAAVVGHPDPKTGELVKAFVVRKDQNLTEKDVIAHCKRLLTSYKIPKEIVFIESLPKTPVGKILRREMRQAK